MTARRLIDLTEREILALAISNEEEDARIFADFAERLRDDYAAAAPASSPTWRSKKTNIEAD